jgi:hypothetical protein
MKVSVLQSVENSLQQVIIARDDAGHEYRTIVRHDVDFVWIEDPAERGADPPYRIPRQALPALIEVLSRIPSPSLG